ncbi:hypothetical protein BcepSauron_270 [Burkholderia phage BcepSauron]|uniref:DUF2116 family Zn-ribbon domain-containing protein n=2 Tax=Sarumanvirus TaxID=2843450 RepID=A0A482MNG2_9CAUD|nr:hypothetical protein H1O16_gp267 [Burkholderia phage BcepSaruman]YP_009904648.1 hypothetical protein H1O17_gp270 [Burkholderia phage BcepSauron]QBQ74650.1 hypothetical protein BcepSauron_270 [Burkholderia phage BcepSauron]QBX06680.1 hypothetical protein BcepSaruman_267 [Burkholderia phage BcepSaruman]
MHYEEKGQKLQREEKLLNISAAVQRKSNRTLLYSGFCYYCYERVHSPHIFCDNACREDYEKEMRIKNATTSR